MGTTAIRPRRGTVVRVLVLLLTALLVGVASRASSADPGAVKLRNGLAGLASSLGGLVDPTQYQDPDDLGQLADALPFSDIDPLNGFDFDQVLASALDRGTTQALNSVDAYVAALDGESVTVGGMPIDVTASATGTGTARDITIGLSTDPATAYREVPLSLPTDAVDVIAGPTTLRVGFDLDATLSLAFDSSVADGGKALALTTAPVLSLDVVVSTPDPVTVSADLGFTDVTVGASVSDATVGFDLALRSPHPSGSPDAGRITAYDWSTTALEDLVEVTRTGQVAATLTLDSDLLAGTPDATVGVSDGDLSDGFQPEFGAGGTGSLLGALAGSDLLDFTNVSPSQVLTGVGQVAAAVSALQSQADVPLPFLKGGVGRSLDMVTSLVESLRQQTVVCGTTATNPPTGRTVGLAAGTLVYCQATTTDTVQPGSTSWTVVPGTGTIEAHGSADGTVAAVPTQLVQVKVASAGVPPVVTVAYQDANGTAKGASQPVPTAQSLRQLLVEQAGFDAAGTAVAYDPDSTALTFTLRRTLSEGVAAPVSLDFADRLKAASGLVGLAPGSGASASVKAEGAVVELTLGVLLADQAQVPEAVPAQDADTASTFLDRFFVQPGAGGRVLSVADLTVTANVALEGRLGFLDVRAGGSLSVTKTAGAPRVLSLSLTGLGNVQATGRQAVPGAVQLTALLNGLGTHVAPPALAVRADGNLSVEAAINGTTLASGGVGFALGPVTSVGDLTDPDKLTVTPTAEFNAELKKFYDMAQDDPLALLNIILDSLTQLAASTEGVAALDDQLPLVGTSPRELLVQFDRLRLAAQELRGAPTATLVCRNTSPGGRDAVTAQVGDQLACRAESLSAATSVQWSVTGGTPVSGGTTPTTVGPPPGTDFTFTASAAGLASPNNPNGFRVSVAWTDASGQHTAQLPSLGAPPTLQSLSDALTRKLGLPQGALTLSLVTADPPGPAPTTRTLRMKLGYGICTNGNTALPACSSSAPGTRVDQPTAPLNVELGNLGQAGGPSYGLTTTGEVALEYSADAMLDVGIPLTASPVPFVFGATGATVAAGVDASGLGFSATIGPLGVALGTQVTGGSGVLKLSGGLGVGTGAADDAELSFSQFASGLSFALTGGQEQDCGKGDFDNDAATEKTALKGQACARLALAAVVGAQVPLGDLGLSLADLTAPGDLQVHVDDQLLEKLKNEVLSVEFLLRALPPLLEQLEASLRSGSAGGQKLPVVGGALDAGADVVGKLRSVVTPASQGLADAVSGVSTAGPLKTALQQHLFGIVGPAPGVGLLLDNDGNGTVEAADVTMTLLCAGGSPCAADAPITAVQDIRLTFAIGQGISAGGTVVQGCTAGTDGCVAPAGLPFDIGLDGLPLRISGALDGGVMWRVGLDFGLSRSDGPYLGVNHKKAGQAVDDVEIGARVTLANRPDACTSEDAAYRAGVTPAAGYSDSRCLEGTLGFLNVNVRDAADPGQRTGIGLVAGLRLTASGVADNGRLRLTDILGGKLGADYRVAAQAKVNLLFRAGIASTSGADIGFPAVLGTFSAGWSYSAGSAAAQGAGTPTLVFDDIYLDGGAFMSKYLQPITQQVRGVTSPLKPVIDTLQTPIPVVSDLAAMVGEDPVTLIALAEALGTNDLSLVKSVIAFLRFANDFPPGQSLLIPLKTSNPGPGSGILAGDGGSFAVDAAQAVTPKTPNAASSLIKAGTVQAGSNLGSALGSTGASTPTTDGRYSTFGVPGLDVPLLRQPSKVFSVLMGQDVTLVEYELGGLRATAGFSYSFGPFMVGPVPVVITIGGGVELDGHFALGYDTSGLRAVFGGAGPAAVLNGLYLRDFDRNGNDVPEIKLAGTVYAGAAVSIAIVTAGIEAGITLTVGLDLDDRPNNDGRMNFDEIVDRLPNPICLFTVEGSLDAFLKAFVKFDFFVTSKRFDFTIVEVHLLDFSLGCSPPTPRPATPDGSTLRLNIGDRASIRGIHVGEENEKFVVRPLQTGGFSVEVFGAYAEYPGTFERIVGDGAAGKDEIVLASGARTSGTQDGKQCRAETPCELAWPAGTRAELKGGPGNDSLTGGSGNDTLDGDGDNDKLAGGAGDDLLRGGAGSDTLDGGVGDDRVYGGTGTGYSEAGDGPDNAQGGPGADHVYGGSGDDLLAGGPGVQPGTAGAPASSFDGADVLGGGSGADSIAGHEGDDTIYGDEALDAACTAAGAGPAAGDETNDDRIEGGPGTDTVVAGNGADTVKGNEGGDVLCGSGGPDTIDGDEPGQTGGDTVRGGPGNDVLNGRQGDDLVDGGTGNDWALGGTGKDVVLGGTGRDRVEGSDGDDLVVGENGTPAGGVPGSLGTSAAANAAMVSGIDDTTDPAEVRLDCALPYAQGDSTPGNSDCVIGGLGNDAVLGGGGPDSLLGDDGADWLDGGSGADVIRGGLLDDIAFGRAGADTLFGDSGDDDLFGGQDDDVLHGGVGADDLDGNEADDRLFGDEGDDRLVGGSRSGGAFDQLDGTDEVRGGPGDDVLLGDNGTIAVSGLTTMTPSGTAVGTFGDDFLYGEDGADQVYGQQGADRLEGGPGPDHLLGDLGAITGPTSGPTVWPGGAPNRSVQLIAQAVGGTDTILGGLGDDHGYGGAAADVLEGGEQDDYLEGNPGQDTIRGGDGQDDLVGGSSTGSVPDPALDEGELVIEGGDGVDVIAGDNADIHRTVGTPATTWAVDPITGGAKRTVVLRYRADAACAGKCGDDVLRGQAGNDQVYGQGGDDTVEGGPGDDYLEGNQATDLVHGHGGSDDVIGGSSDVAGGTGQARTGHPDAGDDLFGDEGDDVIAGDNAVVLRTAPFSPVTDRTGMVRRQITLLDLGTSTAGTYGTDTISGGTGVDVAFGQSGDDVVEGDEHDDYLEGNQGADEVSGNGGSDDVVGGSSEVASGVGLARTGQPDAGDELSGGPGDDVVTGDNAVVLRTGPFHPLTDRDDTMVRRQIALLDLGTSPAGTFGGDTITGGTQVDVAFGQSGDDVVKGDADDDYLEGGQDADLVEGGPGVDDLVGGSGVEMTVDSTDPETATGQPDSADHLFGGAGADLVLGDNAQVLRSASYGYPFSPITTRRGGTPRTLRLLDLGPVSSGPGRTWPNPATGRSGADSLSGGTGVDVLLGQDGGDWISGGPGDDYAEGNGNPPTLPLPSVPGDPDRLHGDQLLSSVAGAPAPPAGASPEAVREGGTGPDGQDDLIGGSSNIAATSPSPVGRSGFRDGDDRIVGNGAADFELGDNGTLVRQADPQADDDLRYVERYPQPYTVPAGGDPRAYVRHAVRLDVPSNGVPVAGTSGADTMRGDGGDDFMWGQSGDDTMHGGDGDDDLLGELGADALFGEAGGDAMVGDRGGIISRYIDGSPRDPSAQSVTQNAPPAEVFVYFRSGTLDRRVHLQRDVAAHTDPTGSVDEFATATMASPGEVFGGADRLRGGPDHDSLHAAAGDDLANGDSGGDTVFGGDGGDVLWGGRGCDPVLDTPAVSPDCWSGGAFDASARGTDDRMVDHVLGGYGGLTARNTGTPELLDFRPRGSLTTPGTTCSTGTGPTSAGGGATVDPCEWLRMTDIGTGGGVPTQHYQGTDWLYGGYDRDVLEGDVTANGPNPGDRLMDWVGTYNLYNHCNAAYGGFNDVRQFSPGMQAFMQAWAYGLGAGPSLAEVSTPGTTGFRELGFVYNKNPDTKENGGSPYSGTPGNFTEFSCAD